MIWVPVVIRESGGGGRFPDAVNYAAEVFILVSQEMSGLSRFD